MTTMPQETHMLYRWSRSTGEYYIGIHSGTNPDTDGYIGSGVLFLKKFDNTPREQWTREVIFFATRELAENIEAFIVDEDTLDDPLCLNLVIGGGKGSKGMKVSDETKAKIGAAQLGRKRSAETKAKMSAAIKGKTLGRKHTDEAKAKMSIANKGANNSFYGKTHTDETKAKISAVKKSQNKKMPDEQKARLYAIHKGSKQTEETKAKIGAAHKGSKRTEEAKAKMKAAAALRYPCAHCDAMMSASKIAVHHNDKCKHKP